MYSATARHVERVIFSEDGGSVSVYRPEGFPFPPAHGRDGFEMTASGRFILDESGPADGIITVMGRWTLIGQRRVSVSFPGTTRATSTFQVLDVDDLEHIEFAAAELMPHLP